jgi:hypothetical protein
VSNQTTIVSLIEKIYYVFHVVESLEDVMPTNTSFDFVCMRPASSFVFALTCSYEVIKPMLDRNNVVTFSLGANSICSYLIFDRIAFINALNIRKAVKN